MTLKITLQKSSHKYKCNITLWETAFIYIHIEDIPQLTNLISITGSNLLGLINFTSNILG